MDNFDVSIIEYLGKVDGGVLVLLGVVYRQKYYEATFFYNESDIILTLPEDLEEMTGPIREHPNYKVILMDILKKIVPYGEIYDRIDPVNFGRWMKAVYEIPNTPEIMDESEVKKSTE